MTNPLSQIGNVAGQVRSPRTILGFFAALTAILGVIIFGLVRILADVSALQWLIPILLIFGGSAFTFIALAILITSWVKPERLMLGEVKGEVYLQMLQLHQGDSSSGEVIEQISIPVSDQRRKANVLPTTVKMEDDSNV
ncbi:hypothetical protein [Aeromonas dhakensis]|uniref:hypothetical protein n=1 Tax=Aeromonas dhakensis TaxID=196024 RepID=UPI003BA004EE